MPSITTKLKQRITHQADLCVKCGMCSTQCPTYRINQNENESPRGRIALAQALANDQLSDLTLVERHINSCLSCLACEKICPSKVAYGDILDNTRMLIIQKTDRSNIMIRAISRLSMRQWRRLAQLYHLSYQLRLPQLFSKMFATDYSVYLRATEKHPPLKPHTEQVKLFTGCLSHIFDQQTHASLIAVLDACKIESQLAKKQTCCGALARHKGYFNEAETCRQRNENAFTKQAIPILFSASACGAHLQSIAKNDSNSTFHAAQEAGQFLLNHKNFQQLQFRALNKRVLIHSPCTEKNVLKASSSYKILNNIPDITLLSLPETTPCCGAAGSYMLQHPANAIKIRQFTDDEIAKKSPDIIVSSNYSCAMHLAAGLRQKGLDIEVLHPLRLLHQQLIKR